MTEPLHDPIPDTRSELPLFSAADMPNSGWRVFRKTVPTRAMRIEGPFRVETSESESEPFYCEDGWLAVDARGYPYAIASNEFVKIYAEIPAAREAIAHEHVYEGTIRIEKAGVTPAQIDAELLQLRGHLYEAAELALEPSIFVVAAEAVQTCDNDALHREVAELTEVRAELASKVVEAQAQVRELEARLADQPEEHPLREIPGQTVLEDPGPAEGTTLEEEAPNGA